MCGRFTLVASGRQLADAFGLAQEPRLVPRYNIAPSQPVAVIRVLRTNPETRERELVLLRWGLIPSWAADLTIGSRLFNARGETVAVKAPFRQAFRRRRCLIPADGFFEWRKAGRKNQPVYFRRKDGRCFALAGLWDMWERGSQIVESCTIITTKANRLIGEYHDRMPVILRPNDYALWLDAEVQDQALLEPLLQPFPGEEMLAYPVHPVVNDPRNDVPECIAPATPDEEGGTYSPGGRSPSRRSERPGGTTGG